MHYTVARVSGSDTRLESLSFRDVELKLQFAPKRLLLRGTPLGLYGVLGTLTFCSENIIVSLKVLIVFVVWSLFVF
jgi:hypothetical protein